MKKFLKFSKIEWSWMMVDWADSSFATICMASILPAFYDIFSAKGIPSHLSTTYWAYTNFIAALVVAILSPFLGAVADKTFSKKKFFIGFTLLGVLSTLFIFFTNSGDYIIVSMLYILGAVGFSSSEVFYNGFLPYIAPPEERDILSSYGFAAGYLGGGLLLLGLVFAIFQPGFFGFSDYISVMKFSFIGVALWWLIFSSPFMILIKEQKIFLKKEQFISLPNKIKNFLLSFKDIAREPEAFKFLIAFWLYNDGIGTIIKMATAYGIEIGIKSQDLILAILLTQFVGIPFTILFGNITKKMKTKIAIFLALMVYIIITIWGAFMKSAIEFYMLAILVGTVQGGSQSLSRSLYSRLIPKEKSAKFFGFYALSSKFSTILGPLLFGIVSQITGHGRYAIFSLVIFFIGGGMLLLKVKE